MDNGRLLPGNTGYGAVSRVAEGCTTVEMECAALAACARKRGASFGQILYTADSLANVLKHDERDWGKNSLRKALELCIAVLQTI